MSTKKRTSKSKRAELVFSVARVQRQMKEKKYSDRVSVMAAVVLAATLEVNVHSDSVSVSMFLVGLKLENATNAMTVSTV